MHIFRRSTILYLLFIISHFTAMSFMITSRTLLCRNFQLLRTHQYRNCDHLSTLSSYTVSNEGDTSATTGVNSKAKIIFVLGGPGAGKGTQCERLSKEFGIPHLSAGELLRQEIATGSSQGQIIDAILKEGRIVPVEMSLGLLRKEIKKLGQLRYLIDGFPRNHDNLEGWLRMMPSVCDIDLILYLQCNEQEMERRILERGLTSNRADDNIETARKRFATFQRDTMPIVEYFASHDKEFNFMCIDGSRSVDVVYEEIKEIVQRPRKSEVANC